MPHISKIKLGKKTEAEIIKNLEFVLAKIQEDTLMSSFLASLLTPTEKIMLAKRLALIILLKEGLNDSEIASTLHVTRITVAKMRYFYEARGSGFEIGMQKLKELEQMKQFKKMLISLAQYSIAAAGGRIKF